jgi:hypothetical protein
LRAQGRHGFDGVVTSRTSWGQWHRGLREDDGVVGSGTARVDGNTGSGMAPGGQRHGLGEDDAVAGLGTAPVWSTTSSAWVWQDGGA